MSHSFSATESIIPPDRAESGAIGLIQDFPSRGPASVQTEKTRLADLVPHGEAVSSETTLEHCCQIFRERKTDYLAVVQDTRVVGLCARGHIGFILGPASDFPSTARIRLRPPWCPCP